MASLLPAYLIVGEDQLKRETAVTRLKARLNSGLAAFNLDERVASPALDPTDVAISLNTLPVGDGFRLVLIHDAHKLTKPVSETIISYLENPNPDCVVCLVAEKLAKNTRLYKAVSRVGKRSVIDCAPLKARDLPSYLMKHAAAKGLSIDAAAARELVSRVGENTVLLDQQLTTLGELCAATRHIALSDVEENVARTAEVKPWEFLDKVGAGDTTRALELYRHMQKPLYISLVALLTRRVRQTICAHALTKRRLGIDAIASELGMQQWQVKRIAQDARRFSDEQLRTCLAACAHCERALKSGVDEETAFLQLVLTICNP